MDQLDQQRRSLLVALAGLGISPLLPQLPAAGQPAVRRGYVLGPATGEHLVHFRDGGNIFITLGAATGSPDLAAGTQQVLAGTGIPIHRHLRMDEAFYVLEGSGNVVLDDVRHAFERGASVFIPNNTWHGFENPDHELRLLWIVSPAGLDGFFRDTCSQPGAPARSLSRDQIREIARRGPAPCHFQIIARRGTCGKARGVPQDHRPAPEPAEAGVTRCVPMATIGVWR